MLLEEESLSSQCWMIAMLDDGRTGASSSSVKRYLPADGCDHPGSTLEKIKIRSKTKAIIIIMSQLFQSGNDDRRRCDLASYWIHQGTRLVVIEPDLQYYIRGVNRSMLLLLFPMMSLL
jgi:hypothetical protein